MPNKTLDELRNESKDFHVLLKLKNGERALPIFRHFRKASRRKKHDVWNIFYEHKTPGEPRLNGQKIIKTLRSFFEKLQDNRCCYCRCALQNIAYAKPIEHILPRHTYPSLSLSFFNLAVSCFDCNQIKEIKKWVFIGARTQKIILSGAGLNFFHPRLHNYSQHIDRSTHEDNDCCISIYTGKTAPGIHLCANLLADISKKRILLLNETSLQKSVAIMEKYMQDKDASETPAVTDFYRSLIENYVIKNK